MNCHIAKLRCLFQNFVNLFTEGIFFVAVALFFQLIDPRLFLDDVNDYQVDFVIALPVPPFSDDIAALFLELLREVTLHHQSGHIAVV